MKEIYLSFITNDGQTSKKMRKRLIQNILNIIIMTPVKMSNTPINKLFFEY